MGTGPQEGLSGVTEEVKGSAKKVAGSLTGNERLREEGQAQQDKSDAKREAAAKEAEADKARAQAAAKEAEERRHQ